MGGKSWTQALEKIKAARNGGIPSDWYQRVVSQADVFASLPETRRSGMRTAGLELKPPKGYSKPAAPTACSGVRTGLYERLRGIDKSRGMRWVPNKGKEAYLAELRGKRRSWLLEQRKGLLYNVQNGIVSQDFVDALNEAAAEADQRPPSPVQLVHTPNEEVEEETVVMNVDYGGKGGKKRIEVPKSLCPDRVGGDDYDA
jgi:hypothetical protein